MNVAKQMNQTRDCARSLPVALALAGTLALGLPSSAQASPPEALRNLAVAGTLATWAWALSSGGAWDCQSDTRLQLEHAQDQELRTWRLGGSLHDCRNDATLWGQALQLQPQLSWTHWRASGPGPGATHADDLTALPLWRWRTPLGGGLHGGVQLGIGATVLTNTHLGQRRKSTAWQFSDQLGLHLEPGDARWRLAWVFRHVSNADIKQPNDSVDLRGMSLEWRW